MKRIARWRIGILAGLAVITGAAWAGAAFEPAAAPVPPGIVVPEDEPATAPVAPSDPVETLPAAADPGIHTEPGAPPTVARPPSGFAPKFDWPTLCWIGAALVLILTIRLHPVGRWRNVDGVVLAGVCILLALRDTTVLGPGWLGRSWEWWAYAGLTAAAAYWLVRGFALLIGNQAIVHPGLISPGARSMLVLVAVALAGYQLATAPLSDAAQDGVIGGLYLNATGTMPHGFVPGHDSRTPLLYMLHAGVLRIRPVTVPDAETGTNKPLTWGDYENWRNGDWATAGDLAAPRLVGALLYILLILGLALLGARVQGGAAGWTLAAIVSVFPGTLECLAQHDVMLGAVLLAWALALAFVPAVGGLLSMLVIVLAGMAWPWLWLTLPVLLAVFLRRGLQGLGAVVGLLGGAAAIVALLLCLVGGAPPREDAALRVAGEAPVYHAELANAETIHVEPLPVVEPAPSSAWTRWGWRMLLDGDALDLEQAARAENISVRPGVDLQVRFRELRMTPEVRAVLSDWYRDRAAELAWPERLRIQTRTLLEATWLPSAGVAHEVTGTWALWGRENPERANLARRIVKIVGGLLAIWATLAIFFGRRVLARHVIGGVLLLVACGMLAAALGPATNLVWLVVPVAALWAVFDVPPGGRTPVRTPITTTPALPRSTGPHVGGPTVPGARITVEGPAAAR